MRHADEKRGKSKRGGFITTGYRVSGAGFSRCTTKDEWMIVLWK
jgi:hypothetical protein